MRLLVWLVSRSEWLMNRYRGRRGLLGRAVKHADHAWLHGVVERVIHDPDAARRR
jgi:hypothetical protein